MSDDISSIEELEEEVPKESIESILTEFITPEDFSQSVEYHRAQYGTSYVEAALVIAERLGLDPSFDAEYIKDLIDRSLKEKLYTECVGMKLLRGETSTQLDV